MVTTYITVFVAICDGVSFFLLNCTGEVFAAIFTFSILLVSVIYLFIEHFHINSGKYHNYYENYPGLRTCVT